MGVISHPELRIGCAGWSIPRTFQDRFPGTGSHLERYAARLPAVEVNVTFHQLPRPETTARWAGSVPKGFRFSAKAPKQITHGGRLRELASLEDFLVGVRGLGERLGPLLFQLPPSLSYDQDTAGRFLASLRERFTGDAVWEPRHPSWFTPEAEAMLARYRVARVAADPAPVTQGATPGPWTGLAYFRLHGSPRRYSSSYPAQFLDELAAALLRSVAARTTWCIFDNTAAGAAVANALDLLERLGETSQAAPSAASP